MHPLVQLTAINKHLSVIYTDTRYALPDAARTGIEQHWQRLLSAGKRFSRGDVFTIQSIAETETDIHYHVALTDYAHYLATIARIPEIKDHPCRVIHTSVLIRTSDGYLAFGEMAAHTSTPGRLQCAGGGLTRADLKDGSILDVAGNARTELYEETGLDCANPLHHCRIKPAYIKSGGTYNFTGAMFVADTMLQACDVEAVFQQHQADLIAQGEQPELRSLVFLQNTQPSLLRFLQEDIRPQEDYLCEWLKRETAAHHIADASGSPS